MSDETLVILGLTAAFLLVGILLGRLMVSKKSELPQGVSEDRRTTRTIDDAKFATQKVVTYILLTIFTGVTATILYQNDQSERSMILQTVINLTLLAVGYWVGASKGAADSNSTIGKIAEAAAPSQAKAVAAARAPAPTEAPDGLDVVTPAPANPLTGNVPAAEVQPEGGKK